MNRFTAPRAGAAHAVLGSQGRDPKETAMGRIEEWAGTALTFAVFAVSYGVLVGLLYGML
jgi:hypothetical protein